MIILVFLEDLKKKYWVLEKWHQFIFSMKKKYWVLEKWHQFIFSIIYKGFLLFQKMTWVVLTKSQLLRLKATFGLKICTEDVTKFERTGFLNSDVVDKKTQKWRDPASGSNRVKRRLNIFMSHLVRSMRSVHTPWMSEQIFPVWTEISVNKSFTVYLHK